MTDRPIEPSDPERGMWMPTTAEYVEYLEQVEEDRNFLREVVRMLINRPMPTQQVMMQPIRDQHPSCNGKTWAEILGDQE